MLNDILGGIDRILQIFISAFGDVLEDRFTRKGRTAILGLFCMMVYAACAAGSYEGVDRGYEFLELHFAHIQPGESLKSDLIWLAFIIVPPAGWTAAVARYTEDAWRVWTPRS